MSKKPNSSDLEDAGYVQRLRSIIERNGGAAAVSRRTQIPESTLSNYSKGTEARFSRIADLAAECDFSLDWLATGKEPASRSTSASGEFCGFDSSFLSGPAHYWAILVLTRTAQEFYEKSHQQATLKQVFEWIAANYANSLNLPDTKLKLVDEVS